MASLKRFAVCEMVPGLPPGSDSGLIGGTMGAGPKTVIVRNSDGLPACFDSQDEAEQWADKNGHDPRLVELVEVLTLTPNNSAAPSDWSLSAGAELQQ